MLISLLHSCSCPLSIFTAFLLIPFSTAKWFVLSLCSHLPFCSYPSLVWNLCFATSPAVGLISTCARSYTTRFPPQAKYILGVFFTILLLPVLHCLESFPLSISLYQPLVYPIISSSHCKHCSWFSQEVTFWRFLPQPFHLIQSSLFVGMRSGKGKKIPDNIAK